jgi:hypothetical protein
MLLFEIDFVLHYWDETKKIILLDSLIVIYIIFGR